MPPSHGEPDSSAGPVEHFAAGLRRLREQAGSPDYRSMARRAGCAHSTLSTAAAGRKLPTLETTLAFVRACGADVQEQAHWSRRWKQVHAELERERGTGPAPAAVTPPTPAPPQDGADGGRARTAARTRTWSWWRGRRAAVLAIGAGVVVAAGIGAESLPGARSSPAPAGGARPVVHGPASPPAATHSALASVTAAEPERRHGPLVMAPGTVVDLDSLASDWNARKSPGSPHHDVEFTDSDHALTGLGNADMAVLPAGDVGTFSQCALEQDYGVELHAAAIRPGVLLCDITSDNRVAMLRVTDVQRDADGTPDQVTFDAVVWVRTHRN
ncbi:helix-turn-helix transcriptional regulator [Streptomyces sp. Li-HN-5-11]|uniref:helix-turn-helix domain-containing protein n=1 Tax=Streptomyces sp. Li-HN-5-11 TaxID=3075432 RepID=UPI0028B14018|nr:helix-turn-helix transcriptional regulator [Streptomyces sp. Li-HN-5-11]WNM32634.1 helix-turn-helix transcriptional regulator [Streptomyces sp. Li-HN-5-11]WOP38614.1 helix-turn-helix transcriptional regulator [Streptomyces sp. Li-HN-5-13]